MNAVEDSNVLLLFTDGSVNTKSGVGFGASLIGNL